MQILLAWVLPAFLTALCLILCKKGLFWDLISWMKETFSVLFSVLSKHGKGEKGLENEGCKTRMYGPLVKFVELDSLLSWCLFNPSLITKAKFFPQVINFVFPIFQVSGKILDSDLQQGLSFPTAAKIRACVSYCVPLNPIFHPPVLCFSDRPARVTASPPLFWKEMSECLWVPWILWWWAPQEKPQEN